jgi:predicted Rossmann fold flavoprotein
LNTKVIIIGGGPAGLMAANQLETHQIPYILLEKNEKCGKKLLITGGKRCNVTNHLPLPTFIDTLTFKHKRFLYPALTRFGPKDVLSFFSEHNLEFILENNFKYFPETEKSASVLNAMIESLNPDCIQYKESVKSIHPVNDGYEIITKDNRYEAQYVIVATGSSSYPGTGSSGDGLIFAKHLNIPFIPFTPAETHVYSEQIKTSFLELKGVSLSQVHVKLPQLKISHQGDLLFTHFGLSGPVIMHLSEFIHEDITLHEKSLVEITIVPYKEDDFFHELLKDPHLKLHKVLETYTTKRLVEVILNDLSIHSQKIVEMRHKDVRLVARAFTQFKVWVDRVEVTEKAYVNKGGIDTKALYPKTFETKTYPGLYFIGETTDLHGPIGGYNITIAMSSGYASAQHIISKEQ